MADNTTVNSMSGGDVIASDDIGGVKYQRIKLITGADGVNDGDVDDANPLPVIEKPLDGRPEVYEDTSFVTGDSPVTHDVNTDLGRDGKSLVFYNDGAGDIQFAVSNDGVSFSTNFTTKSGEKLELNDIQIDQVRLTWVTDSSYRLLVY